MNLTEPQEYWCLLEKETDFRTLPLEGHFGMMQATVYTVMYRPLLYEKLNGRTFKTSWRSVKGWNYKWIVTFFFPKVRTCQRWKPSLPTMSGNLSICSQIKTFTSAKSSKNSVSMNKILELFDFMLKLAITQTTLVIFKIYLTIFFFTNILFGSYISCYGTLP